MSHHDMEEHRMNNKRTWMMDERSNKTEENDRLLNLN